MSRLFWVWKFGGFGGCVQTLKTIVTQHDILTAVWLGADSALCMQLLRACGMIPGMLTVACSCSELAGMIPGMFMRSARMDADSSS